MYKHTIEYVDYNGNPQKETLYFNLSKAEVAEMQLTYPDGLDKHIEKIVGNEEEGRKPDIPEMTRFFKELLLKAYGKKSEDGRRFIKGKTMSEEFEQTEAYSEMFYLLLTDEATMEAFTTAIMPKNLEAPANNVVPA